MNKDSAVVKIIYCQHFLLKFSGIIFYYKMNPVCYKKITKYTYSYNFFISKIFIFRKILVFPIFVYSYVYGNNGYCTNTISTVLNNYEDVLMFLKMDIFSSDLN